VTGTEPDARETITATLRRGLSLSPDLYAGMAGTIALAVVMTAGRVIVPIAIQQAIDSGIRAPGGPDLDYVAWTVVITAALLAVTTCCGFLMTYRLFRVSETALAQVRARVFRHVHDLSMLRQQGEQRGALVSRVTGDIDTITTFLQWNGVVILISAGQVLVTTIVMAVYSWQLTLVVLAVFAPVVFVIRATQRRLVERYGTVRRRAAAMLATIAESVVGAQVIRSYNVSERTRRRIDDAVDGYRSAGEKSMRVTVTAYSMGELGTGIALAGVTAVGLWLGLGGTLSIGQITAYLFLVTMFVTPSQVASEMLNDAVNAVAGWRRVLDVLDLRPDVLDPVDGVDLPAGALDVSFHDVGFAYPGGPPVLAGIDLEIAAKSRVAIVGETGAGKTTLAKLLTRLMDPTTGRILLAGVPIEQVGFASLRSRMVMVPQDGFLFSATVADNVRFGAEGITDAAITAAFAEVGLADWLGTLPHGLATQVGERGEALSVGERQLIAIVRAHVAGPDLLVLDEATSAVDPSTEVRLQQAMDAVTRGRTTVTVAHRLSTAQHADEVIVVDNGRIVQRGVHADLIRDPASVYGQLYAFWLEHAQPDPVNVKGEPITPASPSRRAGSAGPPAPRASSRRTAGPSGRSSPA
jgi:ATP-binding cassette, subfamily B, bacterial